jgi:hypothetical protein
MCSTDCVVRGVITRVDTVPAPGGGNPPEPTNWVRVELKVHETFIGAPARSLICYSDYPHLFEWMANRSEQLFFLTTGRHAGEHHPGIAAQLRLVEWTAFQDPLPIAPDTFKTPIVADDLRVLRSIDAVLVEARHIGKLARSADRTTMILVPENLRPGLAMGEGRYWLELGLTEQAFASARQWIASPDAQMQWCGAEVLVHQQSAENAAALTRFAWSMQEADRYPCDARLQVLGLLKSWGVKDLPPMVRPFPWFDSRQWTAWISLVGWLLAPALLIACKVRRGISWFSIVWGTVLAGIIVLGIRSYWPRDAATFGSIDVALERGDLYVERQKRPDSTLPCPFIVSTPSELLKYRYVDRLPEYRWKLNDLGSIGGLDLDLLDGNSYAERFRPAWLGKLRPYTWRDWIEGPIWRIPIWLIITLMLAPQSFIWFWGWLRRRRRERMRGFLMSVVVQAPPATALARATAAEACAAAPARSNGSAGSTPASTKSS